MTTNFQTLQIFQPRPDSGRFIDHLMGRRRLPATPLVEFIVDETVLRTVVTEWLGRAWAPTGSDRDSQKRYLDNIIAFWYRMGYDVLRFETALPFPGTSRVSRTEVANGGVSFRAWADEGTGMISSWEDFEKYRFPEVRDFDFFPFEYLDRHLPDGMGLAVAHGGGIFERVSWIFSIEKMCYLLHDQADLVQAVVEKVGNLQLAFYRQLMDLERLTVVFPGDDMGFRTATIISPAMLRKWFLPWHARIAEMAHARGVPYFLHSCGNIDRIMPDLIDRVGLDGKHSFEDAIIPAEEFHKKYGDKVAVLGGVDVNILAAGTEAQVRRRVRQLMETCGALGRFAIGSGNSIPDYVPVANYLALVDEALAFRR